MAQNLNVDVHSRATRAAERTGSGPIPLQDTKQPSSVLDNFLPHGEKIRMTQEAKGVFVPYPLLGIILTLIIIVVGGIVAIEVQVGNLSTTILLRDADQRAVTLELKEKTAQMEVYLHDNREKLIRLQSQLDNERRKN